MQINISKTKEIILDRISQDKLELLSTPAGTVERVATFKLLGIHLDDTLTWSTHVNAITSKATKRLYFLKQLTRAGVPCRELLHFLHCSYPSCPWVRGPRLALCHHPSTNTATWVSPAESKKTDSTVCPSEWPPSGASTPYKRWSKCAMKKIGGGFLHKLRGGKCGNNSCASLLSIFTTVLTHCYLLHLHLFSRCCHWSDNRPTLHWG